MTNEFAVIGHHCDDAEDLLLLGGDGRHYHYHLTENRIQSVTSPEGWVLSAAAATTLPTTEPDSPTRAGQ